LIPRNPFCLAKSIPKLLKRFQIRAHIFLLNARQKLLALFECAQKKYLSLFFLFILSFSYIQNHIHTVQSFISIRRGLSPFLHCLLLRGKLLPGVPSWDLNSGLPYSRPAHYQLSHICTQLAIARVQSLVLTLSRDFITTTAEAIFVNLSRNPGIDSQPGGLVRQPYLSYLPTRLHRLSESILGIDSWAP
jgi:hypothetical protein